MDEEQIKCIAEMLALNLLEEIVEGERDKDLDAHLAWYLYTTLSERGPRHCLNN